jgi:TatD DNase family protein
MIPIIDTHAHLDGPEFADDLDDVITRAKEAGVGKIFIPAINEDSIKTVPETCRKYPNYLYPMMGLQPEEVKDDYLSVLDKMHAELTSGTRYIAVGEVGLDFYWSREYEKQQLDAFERQMRWSIKTRLPLMIHCRKAQNELLHIMKPYINELPGGVFHCFTGNQKEAERYLEFDKFVLGVGGVSTFKSSHLREDLPAAVPLTRIVLETDSPYMAPVPHRGQRNESSFVVEVMKQLAISYNVTEEEVAKQTNENVRRVFGDLC